MKNYSFWVKLVPTLYKTFDNIAKLVKRDRQNTIQFKTYVHVEYLEGIKN